MYIHDNYFATRVGSMVYSFSPYLKAFYVSDLRLIVQLSG